MPCNVRLPLIRKQDDAWQREVRKALQDIIDCVDLVDSAAGTPGADGADGAAGPAGPAPAGTGYVTVTGGVLDTPSTPTQVTADLDPFTSSLQGMATASGGGTLNFLRADGTWTQPPGDYATVGRSFFGTGYNGDMDLDGVNTYAGLLVDPVADTDYPIGSVTR